MATCYECGTEVHPSDLWECGGCGGDFCDSCTIEDYCSDCAEIAWMNAMGKHLKDKTDLYFDRYKIFKFGIANYSLYELRHEYSLVKIVLEYLVDLSVPENENAVEGKVTWEIVTK